MSDGLKNKVEFVRIEGFRSLADVQTSLPDLSVMIGANGSGKSNFIAFFEMLSWMLRSQELGNFVERNGGADDQLFNGSKFTRSLEGEIRIRTDAGRNDYHFVLAYGSPDRFFFSEERFRFSSHDRPGDAPWQELEGGHRESRLVDVAQSTETPGINQRTARAVVYLLRGCSTYQFHDTSEESYFKRKWDVGDSLRLRSHGGNLAAILYRLEHEDLPRYDLICHQIGRILPNFDRFDIEESYGKVSLRWKAKNSDKTLGAHLTSDGSLRFFALVTLLNLPPEMLADVILLDEPELGLHPAAINLVGEMIKSLSQKKQVIIATQSPLLVDVFDLENITVLDLEDGKTAFRTLDPDDYRGWLEQEFTPGEMWQKNLLGGRP